MKTILAGYDGTRSAERALKRAAEFAKAFDAKVVVVDVVAPEPLVTPGAFGLMPYYSYRAEEPSQALQTDEAVWQQHRDQVQALFSGAGIAVEFAGVVGVPDEEIIELAEQQHADLIVVGHPRTRLLRAAARRQRQPGRRPTGALRRPDRPSPPRRGGLITG